MASSLVRLAVLAVCACGRIGFEQQVDGSTTGGGSDAGNGRWSLVQVVGNINSQTVPIAASNAGSLIVVAIESVGGVTVTQLADNVGDMYVAVPGARLPNVETWFAEGVAAGATTITITTSGGQVGCAVAWELAGLKASGALDTAQALTNQPTTSTPTGPAITIGQGEPVISVAASMQTVQHIHAGNAFTNDSLVAGEGWAHLTDTNAPAGTYQAAWDLNAAATYDTAALAFLPGP